MCPDLHNMYAYYMYYNGWVESFGTKCLFIFGLLESISDESKTMGQDQNFVLFPNMCSEILCLLLLESNEEILERPKKLVWTANKQVFANPHKSLCEGAKNCQSR